MSTKASPRPAKPLIRLLTGAESQALLARNQVGRIAYTRHDRVDIEPIHYVYDDPWIFGRTTAGAKLATLMLNSWCAFEADEVRSLFEWSSVVVKGQFSAHNGLFATWDYDRAVLALRRLVPEAFTPADPTPLRNIIFGIQASEITGRCSIVADSAGDR